MWKKHLEFIVRLLILFVSFPRAGEWTAGGPAPLLLSSDLCQSCWSVHHPVDTVWSPGALGWKPSRTDLSSQVSTKICGNTRFGWQHTVRGNVCQIWLPSERKGHFVLLMLEDLLGCLDTCDSAFCFWCFCCFI